MGELMVRSRSIRLPGGGDQRGRYPYRSGSSGMLDTVASVPWFLLGLAGAAWEWVSSRTDSFRTAYRARGGYRHVPVDEDAQILRFEDEE